MFWLKKFLFLFNLYIKINTAIALGCNVFEFGVNEIERESEIVNNLLNH